MGWTLASVASGTVPQSGPCAPCYFSTSDYDIQSYPSPVSIVTTATLIPLATYLPNGSIETTGTLTVTNPPPNVTAPYSPHGGNLTVSNPDDLTWINSAGFVLTYPTTYVSYYGLIRADGQEPVAGCTPSDTFATPAIAAPTITIVPNISVSVPDWILSQLTSPVPTLVTIPWTDSSSSTANSSASDVAPPMSVSSASDPPYIFLSLPTLDITSSAIPTLEMPTSDASNLNTPTLEILTLDTSTIPFLYIPTSILSLSIDSDYIDTSPFVAPTTITSVSTPFSTSFSSLGRLRRQIIPSSNTLFGQSSSRSSWQSPADCPPNTTVSSPGPFQVPDFTCSMPSQTHDVAFPSPVDVHSLWPSISQQYLTYIPPLSLLQYLDTLSSVKEEFNDVPLESCSMWQPPQISGSGTVWYFITRTTMCVTLSQANTICTLSTLTTSLSAIAASFTNSAGGRNPSGGAASPVTATLLTAVTAMPSIAGFRVEPATAVDRSTPYSPGATAAPVLAPTASYPTTRTQVAQSSQASAPIELATAEAESNEAGLQASTATISSLTRDDGLLTRLLSLATAHASRQSVLGANTPSDQQQTIESHGQQDSLESSVVPEAATLVIQDDEQTFIALPGASSIPVARLGGVVLVGSQKLDPEHVLTIGGQVISLATDGSQFVLAAELQSPTSTTMATLATQQAEIDVSRSGAAIIVNGQTLPTGSQTTIAGHVLSQLSGGSGFVLDGSTTSIITISDGQHTQIEFGMMPTTADIIISHSGTSFLVGSSTLLPGSAIISAGQTVSLDQAGSTAFINGSPVPTGDTLFTVASTVFQTLSSPHSAIQTGISNAAGLSSTAGGNVAVTSTASIESNTSGAARTSALESALRVIVVTAMMMVLII